MRIVLHIGTHKTGTTAIQKYCASHRDALRRQGLWYPDYDLIGAEGHYAHHHLANALAGLSTSRGGEAEADRFLAGIRAGAGDHETVLISAESFWRHLRPPEALSVNEYEAAAREAEYWQRRRAFVGRVARSLGTGGVEIVAVLRRQDRCAESMYKERVKGTAYAEPFGTYLEAFSHRYRYYDQLSVWREYFPTVHALVYEDLAGSENLAAAFFAALDVAVETAPGEVPKFNVSLNNDLVAFKRRLNRAGLPEDRLWEVAELMQQDTFSDGLALDPGSSLWPGRAARDAFLDQFREQNALVLEHFTGLAREHLFPSDCDEEPPAYPGLNEETARAIARRIASLSDTALGGKQVPVP